MTHQATPEDRVKSKPVTRGLRRTDQWESVRRDVLATLASSRWPRLGKGVLITALLTGLGLSATLMADITSGWAVATWLQVVATAFTTIGFIIWAQVVGGLLGWAVRTRGSWQWLSPTPVILVLVAAYSLVLVSLLADALGTAFQVPVLGDPLPAVAFGLLSGPAFSLAWGPAI